jgi:hypothetical protein
LELDSSQVLGISNYWRQRGLSCAT